EIPPPPPNVVITPPDHDPNATTRQRFAQHTADPFCHSCHRLMDPVGFGFEGYDELGRFRTMENNLPIDDSGEIEARPDPMLDGSFQGPVELAMKLSRSPVVEHCISTEWYRYAMGRGEAAPEDSCALETANAALVGAHGDFRELLVAIVKTDA